MSTPEALLAAARALAGRSVEVRGNKGGAGMLIERALGLKPRFDEVDDPDSGVEVKTLPVTRDGKVKEGTYVTMATVETLAQETWATSRVKKKLTCVLFVPIVHGVHEQPVIGSAFLWRPTIEQEAVLRADWEDLSDLVSQGLGFAVRATRGRSLQLRPKASSSRDVRTARVDGEDVVVKPQGFYLRPSFTVALLREAVLLA